MRAIFGTLGLLVVLAIVGLLVKKQLSSPPVIAAPAGISVTPSATVQQQSQQVQQQYQQAVEGAMRQPRPVPEDKKE